MRCRGALAACASSTSRMMRESTVSTPTARTCITTRPSPLMEPPVSRAAESVTAPGAGFCAGLFSTGSGSPVSMDSSTWVRPSSSSPSTGNRSPGLTTNRSPTSTSATGTSTSPSSPIRCATSGRKACRARMAAVVWRLARASSHLPSITSVITKAEPSKYRCTMAPGSAVSHSHMDSAQPAVVPMATSKSILPVRAFRACQPPV